MEDSASEIRRGSQRVVSVIGHRGGSSGGSMLMQRPEVMRSRDGNSIPATGYSRVDSIADVSGPGGY
jgi:hypothetical protein